MRSAATRDDELPVVEEFARSVADLPAMRAQVTKQAELLERELRR